MCSFPTAPLDFRPRQVQRKWLRQQPTTGNSNMTAQTGNTYIARTIIDSVAIPMAITGFWPQRVQRKCPKWLQQRPTTGNSNLVAQTENTYISGTMLDSVEISKATLVFSTMTSSKSAQNDCENDRQRELAIWPPKPEILIYLELWQMGRNSNSNSGIFDHAEFYAIYRSTRNISISGLGGHIVISGSRSLSQSFGGNFFELVMIENPRIAVEI